MTVGGELGVASGDSAPGLRERPDRTAVDANQNSMLPPYGSIEGPQYGQPATSAIRNFRFNPGYRVDLILWRQILGQVTDAWYLKPKLRWDILPGLAFDAAVDLLAGAQRAGPTPGSVRHQAGDTLADVKKPLGLEVDGMLTYDARATASRPGRSAASCSRSTGLEPATPGARPRRSAFGLAAKSAEAKIGRGTARERRGPAAPRDAG